MNERERLEIRIGQLVEENRQLHQRVKETQTRVCQICDSDHSGVKGIVGHCNCYLCFDCQDKAKAKLTGLGTVTIGGKTYKIVPVEE
jgi:hypothetical protein